MRGTKIKFRTFGSNPRETKLALDLLESQTSFLLFLAMNMAYDYLTRQESFIHTFQRVISPGELEVCLDDEVAVAVGPVAAAVVAFAIAESSAA